MRAMILAAGLGTRLRPLTLDRPKALVEVAGRTLLEMALGRLRRFGIREVIVNTHHLAGQIEDYLKVHDSFGMRIEISREPTLLDTGGGLKRAAWFFLESQAAPDEPFLLMNVDVLSTIDLERMVALHRERRSLATLAVQHRSTSRYLLFDPSGYLCGRRSGLDGQAELVGPVPAFEALAFSGLHILDPQILVRLDEEGPFSIISAYLRLAREGCAIEAFLADGAYWRDLGRPSDLLEAARDLETGAYPAEPA
jgi:NDP-sugar pyrophosphorylase family protein